MKNTSTSFSGISIIRAALLALIASLSGGWANASTITWTGASSQDWNTAADWNSGAGPVPGSGDTALFNTATGVVTNISANQSVGSISFDTSTASLLLGSNAGNSFTLTSGGAIAVLSTNTGSGTDVVQAPLILAPASSTTAGTYTFANNTANSETLNFSGTVSGGTTTSTETLNLTGNSSKNNTISGLISNGGAAGGLSIFKSGSGLWILTAANTNTGSLSVAGLLTLNGANGAEASVSSVNVNGLGVNGVGTVNSQLLLDNSSVVNLARLSTTVPISLDAGGFAVKGNASVATTESFGAVTLVAAHNNLTVLSLGGGATITLASLTNNNNAILTITGSTATSMGGGTEKLLVTSDSNLTSGLIGGGGAAGTTDISILPWAVYSSDSIVAHQFLGSGGLLTYSSGGGFRVLAASEYNTNINSAAATDNVEVTASTTLSTSETVNALYLNGSTFGQSLNLTGKILTVTSGAIDDFNFTTFSGGTINFGSATGYITGSTEPTITTLFTGTSTGVGLVFGGGGAYNIDITGSNYTGSTIIAAGTVQGNVSNALPTGTDLRIDLGGVFTTGSLTAETQQVKSLSGSGTVKIGNATGQLNVGTGAIVGAAQTVTVGAGGSISPGDPSGALRAGIFNVGGTGSVANLSFLTGSTLNFDLASDTQADLISVLDGGATIASGATLSINLLNGYTPTSGTTWNLLDTTTGISGTFAGLPTGFSDSIVGDDLILAYTAPEPGTWALILGGLAMLVLIQRRKSKLN